MKQWIGLMITGILAITFCGCTMKREDIIAKNNDNNKITLTFLSNLPTRTSGQGLLEQQLIDTYMSEHPNIKIEVEALQDEVYKKRFEAGVLAKNLPDVVFVWGQPAFIEPAMNAGCLAVLEREDYQGYDFFEDAFTGFSNDGKLYGLPRNTDILGFFYNKNIFDQYGLTEPQNMQELYQITMILNKAGVIPCAMDGHDKWPISILYSDIIMKMTGDSTLVKTAVTNQDFSADIFKKAAENMKLLMDKGTFQRDFLTTDYNNAKQLFTSGNAAMFYTGSWELSMAVDQSIDSRVREGLRFFALPVMDETKTNAKNITAWNGGGYSISSNSEHLEEARKLLNYMCKKENWVKAAYQNNICIPAQSYEEYVTGTEAPVQKQASTILLESERLSGTPISDLGSAEFKREGEEAFRRFMAGEIDVDELIQLLNTVVK